MSEEKPQQPYRGRIAPTPSGYLHQGHIRTFRTAWNRAREKGGQIVFRMDDLDPSRCNQEYANACTEDIRSMGIDWDEGPDRRGDFGPYEQSKRGRFYLDALQKLFELDLIYPCEKSRKEIKALGLLDSSGSEFLFPESFRPDSVDLEKVDFPGKTNWRFRTNWGGVGRIHGHKKTGH